MEGSVHTFVMEIISEVSGLKMTEIKKEGDNSEILPGEKK